MCDRGYDRASEEYESKMFNGVPQSEEELLNEIEEQEFWNDYYLDQQFEEIRVRKYEEENCQ